jgi:hypothetical protein
MALTAYLVRVESFIIYLPNYSYFESRVLYDSGRLGCKRKTKNGKNFPARPMAGTKKGNHE